MKKEIKKAFLDFDKEEQWLNEQGQNGLMLLNYYNGTYEFEDVNPTKYLYKIEIPKKFVFYCCKSFGVGNYWRCDLRNLDASC